MKVIKKILSIRIYGNYIKYIRNDLFYCKDVIFVYTRQFADDGVKCAKYFEDLEYLTLVLKGKWGSAN